jgi:sortase A
VIRIPDPVRRTIAIVALLFGIWQCAGAAYIQGKAVFAQYLLECAWSDSQLSGTPAKPWPWADTAPVARLRLERLSVDEIVLAGDSGRTLAFGPGWSQSSAEFGAIGNTIVSGHRDTHFAFLREVKIGDEIEIELRGRRLRYAVIETHIADATASKLDVAGAVPSIQMVTCYPFDAVMPGGPQRYVVTAELTGEIKI